MLQFMTYEQALSFTGFVAVAMVAMVASKKKVEVEIVEKDGTSTHVASAQREKTEQTRLVRTRHADRKSFRDMGYGRQYRTAY